MGREGMGWDRMSSDGMIRDGMGWDAMRVGTRWGYEGWRGMFSCHMVHHAMPCHEIKPCGTVGWDWRMPWNGMEG